MRVRGRSFRRVDHLVGESSSLGFPNDSEDFEELIHSFNCRNQLITIMVLSKIQTPNANQIPISNYLQRQSILLEPSFGQMMANKSKKECVINNPIGHKKQEMKNKGKNNQGKSWFLIKRGDSSASLHFITTNTTTPFYQGLRAPTIQSSIANHSLHRASAARISSSEGSRRGRKNGVCSSGRIS